MESSLLLKIQINYRKQNDQNKKYASNDVILQIIYHSNRCFYDKQKPFSEFLFYFESVIIFEGRLHVSTTWICNGICLYVFNYDKTYVSTSSININSNYFRFNWSFMQTWGL